MKGLESLGREVARQQDEALAEARAVAQASAALEWPAERSLRWPLLAVAAVLVCVVAALLVVPRPIAVETAGVAVASWVSAEAEAPVTFSDGATLLVRAGSRFQVEKLHEHGAEVRLERGAVSVSIPHRDDTRWTLAIGPYTVKVVGTRFDTGWEPSSQTFSLVMHDGAVRVVSPDGTTTQYVAGQTVTVSLSPPVAPDEVDALAEPPPTRAPGPPRAAPASWKSLAQRGQYGDALAAARRAGWAKLGATLPADDLALLGDVGRLGGDVKAARDAYGRTRARFPRSAAADTATFFLGRLAFDERDAAGATKWFERYEAEFPNGPFGAEALGRRVELTKDAVLARRYLERYPTGPHSRLAKAVLGGD